MVIGPVMHAEGSGPRAIAELNERAFAWVKQTQQRISAVPLRDEPVETSETV
ncbi:hypothetical protein D3C78_1654770 [compost metagenome]